MNFKASMDWLCTVITTGTTLLFFFMFITRIIPLYASNPVKAVVLGAVLIAIYAYCFFQRPLGYSLSPKDLKVRRPLKDFVVECRHIKDVRIFTRNEMKFTIRTFGVGGLFGYFGRFSNSKIGRIMMFATRRDRTVLIETIQGKKIIVTPDDPDLFVRILRSAKSNKAGGVVNHAPLT